MNFESRLAFELSGLFSRMAKAYRDAMLETGVPPDFTTWESFFDDMLRNHYNNVSKVFSKRLELQEGVTHTQEENELIQSILAAFFVGLSNQTINHITETNTSQAQQSVARARVQEQFDFETTGQRYDMKTMATVAGNIFETMLFSRVATIAQTETQKSAEAAKKVEADVIITGRSDINTPIPRKPEPGEPITKRIWSAILDDVTRPSHVKADGQIRKVGENFIVGGHPMRYPGDTNAPIEEWINCRCNALYYIPDVIKQKRAA